MAPIPPKIKKQADKNPASQKEIRQLHETDEQLQKDIKRNKNTAKRQSEKAYTRSVEYTESQDYIKHGETIPYATESGYSSTSGTSQYANEAGSASIAGYATEAGSAAHVPWRGVTDPISGGNEFNVCDSTPSSQRFWFNYTGRGGNNLGSPIIEYYFGNGQGSTSGTKVFAGSFYADNDVSCQSDIHFKKVVEKIVPDVEAIAKASVIRFKWIDGRDDMMHTGAIAQEWQKIIPDAVTEIDGTLTMNYGAIGVASVISLAKTVVEQQKILEKLVDRIEQLEKRHG